jgi:hypothetical protein
MMIKGCLRSDCLRTKKKKEYSQQTEVISTCPEVTTLAGFIAYTTQASINDFSLFFFSIKLHLHHVLRLLK